MTFCKKKNQLWACQLKAAFLQRTLFIDLNLSFSQGQVAVILGKNGAGKSTLLNYLAGIKLPPAGEVYLNESPLHRLSCRERALAIASIGQNDLCIEYMKVAERIAQGLSARVGLRALMNEDIYRQVQDIAAEFNLLSLLHQDLRSLSVGERKRTHVARALIDKKAHVFILDEPEAGLDVEYRQLLVRVLRDRANEGKIIVLAVHDLALADSVADKVVHL